MPPRECLRGLDCSRKARITRKRRYGEREAWMRERIGATWRVRSEPIVRKQVDTANAGVDQREDRSHEESASRADCEEACARGGEDRVEAKGKHNQ